MDDLKMVIVMRDKYPDGKGGSFSPRKGKMCAQAAHAASTFLLRALSGGHKMSKVQYDWAAIGMKKICVRAESEEELLDIERRAKVAGLTVHLITDSGLTEFDGPTRTCLAIGPDYASKIDPITGALKLL